MPNAAAEIFRQAAALNSQDARRQGNVLMLEPGCEVIVAGDIHGHRANLTRIINFAALPGHPQRRLILQEIIHGPEDPATGHDRSAELLLRAARLKVAHPQQVLFVLGNHDVAQVTGNEITKDGRGVCKAFEKSLEPAFGADAGEVSAAMTSFFLSMPLAVKTPGGVFCTHSLPSPKRVQQAGTDIFARPYRPEDFHRGGPVYEWTWGRNQTPEELQTLAANLPAAFFILGHKPVEEGWEMLPPCGMILTSHHDRGCVAVFNSDQPLTSDDAPGRVLPILSLSLSKQ